MDHAVAALSRLATEPLGAAGRAIDKSLDQLVEACWSAFDRTRAGNCRLGVPHRNLWRFHGCQTPQGGDEGAHQKSAPGVRILLPFLPGGAQTRRPQGKMDNIIEARELQIERKHFYVELRENDRGRFLRITEEAHGRRNSIIVPSTGVDDFTATIAEVLTNGETAPA